MNTNGHEPKNGLTRIFANSELETIRVNSRNSRQSLFPSILVLPIRADLCSFVVGFLCV
jgi:hypothetical protein